MTRLLTIATWNINSIRLRYPLLATLDHALAPDIICLQETKVADPSFPIGEVKALGYPYIAMRGEKGYNGVAILSRVPFTSVQSTNFTNIIQTRHISVMLENGVEIHNLYIPAGGDIPDPKLNRKFEHKLCFLAELTHWFQHKRPKVPMVLVGDLNIAPLPDDVWSHKQLLTVVSHTPVEVEALHHLSDACAFVDVTRHFHPTPEKIYSWWSYRNQDWQKSDRGRRLDHIWVTPDLKSKLVSTHILKEARNWPNPSDHVPVVASMKL